MQTNLPSVSRRNFLAMSAALPAAVLAQSLTTGISTASAAEGAAPAAAAKYPVGIELYSVRNHLLQNLPDTLTQLSKLGYNLVEFYAPYYDWSIPHAKEVRALMDDLGMRCYSTHNHIESFTPGPGMAKAIEINQIIGAHVLVLATAPGGTNGLEGWKNLCGKLTEAVNQLAPHGLFAGFHNHQTEWVKLDGDKRVMDVLAANTPREFVLQFDVGTCMEAKNDPIAWINANPGRIRSIHLKDWAPGSNAEEKGYRTLFGEGISPWKEIVAAAKSVGGVEYFLIEQEGSRYSEFETAQRCLATWKSMFPQG